MNYKTYLLAACVAASTSALASEPPKDVPKGPLGDAVLAGYDMIVNTQTNPKVKAYVGNALNCASCHTEAGTAPRPGNLLTTATKFPSYGAREDTVLTLEDRINNCFMRSMDGMRPSTDSEVTVDMAAYIAWLARGKALYAPAPAAPADAPDYAAMTRKLTHANYASGAAIYTAQCAACHGADGAGMGATFPPVWGPRSYNAGAGLANVPKLAAWARGNMPKGNAHLTAQEAVDVALYVDAQPRPEFVLAKHLPAGTDEQTYNAHRRAETDTVESNLHKFGLDIKTVRGE